MTEHMHASCQSSADFAALHQNAQTCAARVGNDKVFLTSVTACLEPEKDGSSFAYVSAYLEDQELTERLKVNDRCYSASAGGPMFAS